MQRIFSALKQAVRQSLLVVGAMIFLALPGVFIFVDQPASAAVGTDNRLIRQEYNMSSNASKNQKAGNREAAYEEVLKEAQSPETMEEAYEENLDEYRKDHPAPGLVEKAEELIEDVTGTDLSK